MKRLLCRLFVVMALVTGIVTPSAGLAFADPSTDTTIVPVPPVPPAPPVQGPVAPVIPTQGVSPPVNPVPQVPVVDPIPVQAPQPVPQPGPVVTPVVPAPAPVVVPQQVPQQAPVPVKTPDPVPVPAPAPVIEQPTVVPKPAPQPVPVQSPPPVISTTPQVRPVPVPSNDTAVVTPVTPTKSEAPQDNPGERPTPQLVPPATASTGVGSSVDSPPLPPNGNRQQPPSGVPNDVPGSPGGIAPPATVQSPDISQQINQGSGNEQTVLDTPRRLPPPGPANPFPDWGYNQPTEVQPLPVPGHGGGSCNAQNCNNNGPGPVGGPCTAQNCNNNGPGPVGPCTGLNCNNNGPGPVGGGCGTPPCTNPGPGGCGTPPCGGPGPIGGGCGTPPCGPPPPIIPDRPVYNPWQNGNHQLPPPNPNIFVRGGNDGQVVFINNVTQINNTVINNNAPAIVYLTNFATNRVLSFNANYGTPFSLSPGWCGGLSGGWGWSANVNILGFGASFAGGGAFNVGAGCGYIPPPIPVNPLPIYSPGYPPVYASNYFEPQGCGCVYADNTYLYGNYQQVPIQGVPQQAFVPTSYTPDIVFQQPTEGLPPFMTGDELGSTNWFAKQPAVLWVSIGVVMLGLMGLAYVNRERLTSMLR